MSTNSSTIFIKNISETHQFSICHNLNHNQLEKSQLEDLPILLQKFCVLDDHNFHTSNPDLVNAANIVTFINGLYVIVTKKNILCHSPWAASTLFISDNSDQEVGSDVELIRNYLIERLTNIYFNYQPIYNILKITCEDHYQLLPIANYEVDYNSSLSTIVVKKVNNQYQKLTFNHISDLTFRS